MHSVTAAFEGQRKGLRRLAQVGLAVLGVVSLGVLCSSKSSAQPVHIWEKVEITLEAQAGYDNPYTDVEVWLDLEGPGFSKRCYGFWDGGNSFHVRILANAPGAWTWRSGSAPADPGLAGKQGTFEAVAWTRRELRKDPNRRGQIRIAPGGRYFEYADGTPFFLLADTLWAGNTLRCGLGENHDGPFFEYLTDRIGKGFTTILLQRIHGYGDYPNGQAHRNEGGHALNDRDPDRPNPAYFQALDARMDAIAERGLVTAVPTMWWGKTNECVFTPEEALRLSMYLAARYGTYNALWCLSGEYQYTFTNCGWTPADFTAMGEAVQARNPWKHPLSIHPSGHTNWKPPHNVQSSKPFHGESWLDHHWLQTGQSFDRMHCIVTRLAENRALEPASPIFCSESFYEIAGQSDSDYLARWQVWSALLNGAAGYGYGAQGLWQFLDPDDPEGETGKMTNHPPVPWREAIRLPGSAQVGHARTLLESTEWWRLAPRRDVLRVDGRPNPLPTATDITPPQAASVGEDLWVLYIPRGNADRTISASIQEPERFEVSWFNPRTGTALEVDGEFRKLGAEGEIPRGIHPAEDWVLMLQRRN